MVQSCVRPSDRPFVAFIRISLPSKPERALGAGKGIDFLEVMIINKLELKVVSPIISMLS